MRGSKLYNDVGRGECVSYGWHLIPVEDALDILAGGSYASEEILKDRGNVERLICALERLKAQIAEAEEVIRAAINREKVK